MPGRENESPPGTSGLAKKIAVVTSVVVALTALTTALVKFRDSIPWLTPVSSIELTPNPVDLTIGDKIQMAATVRDANKNALGKTVKWSSANPSVVKIDNDGNIVCEAAGETTITASAGYVKALAPVTVRRVNVARIDIFPPSPITLAVSDQLKFDATPYDSEGDSLASRPIRWASGDQSVASVDSSGEATAKSAGKAVITAESQGEHSSVELTVRPKSTALVALAARPAAAATSTIERSGTGIAAEPVRIIAVRPPSVAVMRAERASANPKRPLAMNAAVAGRISIAHGLKHGACPAHIRILIGSALIDVKSDPQEVAGQPLGNQHYDLHGTVSCPRQTVAIVNGRGTIDVVSGKTYLCRWHRKGSKDFEITLQPE